MAAPNTFGGRPLRDPADLLRECVSRNLPTAHWCGRPTVAAFPAGRRWGTAEFLMAKGDLDKLDLTADHDLVLGDSVRTVTAKRLSVLTAVVVLPGLAADAAATYLVTAVDRRYHLDRSPFSKAYNVPDGAGGLVTATTNGGTPWTWATMVADLWARLPAAVAGPAPTLPFTPDGRPEGWRFWGHPSAWQALNDVLDRLCCAAVLDPTTDTLTVERLGATDAAATAFETNAAGDLQWDERPATPKRTSRPEKVSVRFRRSPVPADGGDPFYAVAVTLPAQAGTVTGTTVLIADDLTALGASGTPTNAAALATRAAERAADYARALAPAEGTRARSWRGVRPEATALPGSLYAGLSWDDRGTGWATGAAGGQVPGTVPELGERWPGGGGTLTTGNVGDGGAQDSTTTVLRFRESTGIRVDKGATDADPDIAELVFGTTLSVVTSVCPTLTVTKDGAGKVTDVSLSLSVERRTLTLPTGTVIGPAACTTNPTDCCATVTVGCCGDPMPTTLYVTISDGGGSYPLVWNGGSWANDLVTVPGCGTISFKLYCIASVWVLQWNGGSVGDSGTQCQISATLPAASVVGCTGGGFVSMAFTATFAHGSADHDCACVGTTRTFTVTP